MVFQEGNFFLNICSVQITSLLVQFLQILVSWIWSDSYFPSLLKLLSGSFCWDFDKLVQRFLSNFLCVYLELLQSQIIYTLQRVYTTALSQNAYLSRVCHSFICRMRASIPTTIVVEGVPTGLVETRQVCCKTSSHKLCCGRFSHSACCGRYSHKA